MPGNYYEYEEEYSRRRRDQSPEYYSGGAPKVGHPQDQAGPPPPPPPGVPPYASTSRLDETFGPPPPRDRMTLPAPPADSRPRSVPPPDTVMVRRARSRAGDYDDDDDDRRRGSRSRSRKGGDRDRDRSPSPITRARSAIDENFSNTAAGIGAGLLGAVVGGLVAKEASEAAARRKHKEKGYGASDEDNRTRLVSTLLGAVAGGLGANAIANKVEDSRERDRARQEAWERKFGRDDDRYDRYDSGRPRDREPIQMRDRERRNSRGPPPYNDNDEYDFVYDDPRYADDRREGRRRSEESFRYKQ